MNLEDSGKIFLQQFFLHLETSVECRVLVYVGATGAEEPVNFGLRVYALSIFRPKTLSIANNYSFDRIFQ